MGWQDMAADPRHRASLAIVHSPECWISAIRSPPPGCPAQCHGSGTLALGNFAFFDQPAPLFYELTGDAFPYGFPTTVNVALGKPVSVVQSNPTSGQPSYATDGEISDTSRYVAQPSAGPLAVEVNLTFPATLLKHTCIPVSNPVVLTPLSIWNFTMVPPGKPSPGSGLTGNAALARRVTFSSPVTTSRVRYVPDGLGTSGFTRLKEITLWEQTNIQLYDGVWVGSPDNQLQTAVAVNQIGYQKGAPKRFTAITSADGTPFSIAAQGSSTLLFSGQIQDGNGDFTAFEPASNGPYVITVSPTVGLPGNSDPFLILDDLIGEKYLPAAVHFMIDARSAVGTHPSGAGGGPWRDCTYYGVEIPSLVHLLLSQRNALIAMPREIDWASEKAAVTTPAFDTTYRPDTSNNTDVGLLAAIRRYYNDWDAPRADAPDVVKLIHFSMAVTIERPRRHPRSVETLQRGRSTAPQPNPRIRRMDSPRLAGSPRVAATVFLRPRPYLRLRKLGRFRSDRSLTS